MSRRAFLQTGLVSASTLAFGCSDDTAGHQGASTACADPFVTDPDTVGERLEALSFLDEAGVEFHRKRGVGWDSRLATQLSELTPDSNLVPNEHFYIRTEFPDQLVPPTSWAIRLAGLIDTPRTIELDGLLPRVRSMGAHALECSGNGSGAAFGLLSAADWDGITLADWFDTLELSSSATRVLISGFDRHSIPSVGGHSTPGASWVFSFQQIRDAGGFLATGMNGKPLPADHGSPVRLFMPNWYGCCAIKWVDEIRFTDDSEPATSQMIEFASRTHQQDTPTRAAEYAPATMDQAAMPTRVERWRVDGRLRHRIVGIMWGGYNATDRLAIRIGDRPFERVQTCPPQTQNQTFTFWAHSFDPPKPGTYGVRLRVDDPSVPQQRLDSEFYYREFEVPEI